MGKVILLRGLPASGKTTAAKEILERSGNYVRVNKDLLREMVHFNEWRGPREEGILKCEMGVAGYYLVEENKCVVVDDTNLNEGVVEKWKQYIKQLNELTGSNHTISEMWVDTPMWTCVERAFERAAEGGRKVPPDVIIQMAMQYKKDPQEYKYVICDLDGTLASIEHRLHYAKGPDKDWGAFFRGIPQDKLRTEVLEKVQPLLSTHNKLVLVSARPDDQCRRMTEEWLRENHISYLTLIMRQAGDRRDDTIVKREILNRFFPDRKRIVKVFDDRPSVIRMWREEGLEVEDVGKGVEF